MSPASLVVSAPRPGENRAAEEQGCPGNVHTTLRKLAQSVERGFPSPSENLSPTPKKFGGGGRAQRGLSQAQSEGSFRFTLMPSAGDAKARSRGDWDQPWQRDALEARPRPAIKAAMF